MKSLETQVFTNKKEIKQIMKEVLEEFFMEKKILQKVFLEVIEDIGMINAIQEGEKDSYINEKEIAKILKNI